MDKSYIFNSTTEKKFITMEDFYSQIKLYLKDDDIKYIVDAGSLDGADAIFLKNKYMNANTYAIEGLPDNYEKFLHNNTQIIPINAVIANYDGNIDYHQKNINGIHGIYNRGDNYGNIILNLPCYKLSTIMNNYNIPDIDILKIDVEGATYDLLLSLENNLSNVKIMHIETETYPFFEGQTLHNDVCLFLIKNNFILLDIVFVEITPNNYQSDSIWINKNIM
jgi:FkbM family methyltransferase